MDRIPGPGEIYRHFKNNMYQVIAVATHSETGEKMVVYQALYGNYGIYVRPLSMFMEPVDREKYPQARQEYRFERVILSQEEPISCGTEDEVADLSDWSAEEDSVVNPLLLDFLEEEICEKRLGILQTMKGRVGQKELDSLYICLDLKPVDGTIESQLENIKQYLSMQQRYDAARMRRS